MLALQAAAPRGTVMVELNSQGSSLEIVLLEVFFSNVHAFLVIKCNLCCGFVVSIVCDLFDLAFLYIEGTDLFEE